VTALELLGARVAAGYGDDLPGALRDAVRLHLVDTVGAWVAAGATPEGRALRHFLSPEPNDLSGRVGLACALARSSEVDDIHLASGTTPGAIVVPAALMLAASLGRDGVALAEGIAVGYDAMARLGAALNGPSILYRGIWPTYLCAPFAVAAVAARLLDLDPKQAAHALASALALSAPAVGRQAGAHPSRWLAIGSAAGNGLVAARSAQAGFTGDLRLFESGFFSSAYGIAVDLPALHDEQPALGTTSFKPWCAAKQTMAAAQAVKELVEEGARPSEMSELAVGVPPPYLKMIDHGVVPGERASFLTSVQYQMAVAGLNPDAALDLRVPERVSEAVQQLMERISVKADEDFLRHYPGAWPARVTITTPAGKREKLVLHVPGDPGRAFGEAQVAVKFRRLVAPVAGERGAEALLQRSLGALDQAPAALLAEIGQLENA